MSSSGPKSLPAIGFLSILPYKGPGFLGGYLVLNAAGRPLEFHCTAPVKTNRAQEILYGSTLIPYLYGEQIGQTLIRKSKVQPLFVCTDVEPALAVREFTSRPVVLVLPEDEDPPDDAVHIRADQAHPNPPRSLSCGLVRFQIDGTSVAVAAGRERDRQQIGQQWQSHGKALDLSEPFERIRQAIDEAVNMEGGS